MHKLLFAIGLAAIAPPLAAQTPDWGTAQTVDVVLDSFRYMPATLQFDHGKPYRLHLVNRASGAHDFAAKEFFAAARLLPRDASKVVKGAISLAGGENKDIAFVAPSSPGVYKLRCTHFMHSTMGMTGEITVR